MEKIDLKNFSPKINLQIKILPKFTKLINFNETFQDFKNSFAGFANNELTF